MKLIDADVLIANLDKALLFARTNEEIADLKLCKEIVRSAPAVSPDEVRGVGKWKYYDSFSWRCSRCKWINYHNLNVPNLYNYCPNCGARLMGKEND